MLYLYPTPIIIATTVAFVVYALFALFQVRRFESKFIPFIWIVALVIIGILVYINIVYIRVGAHFQHPSYDLIHRLFSFDIERTLSNTYSGILLFSLSVASFLIIFSTRPSSRFDVRYWVWLMIGVLFAVIGYDEAFNPPNLHGGDLTLYGYILSGAISALMLLYIIVRVKTDYKWRYIWMFLALGLLGFAGVILDNYPPFGYMTGEVALLEEILEVLGTLTIFIVAMSILHSSLPRMAWHGTKLIALGAVLSIVFLFVTEPRVQPTFAYMTSPVIEDGTRYAEDPIEIIGHTFSSQMYSAGDTIAGYIYFRPSYYVRNDYSFSAHLISLPEIESVAQQDNETLANAGLTTLWIPRMIVQQPVILTIPDDITTLSAYSLAIRIWSSDDGFVESDNFDDWQEQTQSLGIEASPHPTLGNGFLRLIDFSVVPPESPAPAEGLTVDFVNGSQLVIDELEATTVSAGDTLSFDFQWSADNAIKQEWQQFIHLQNTETEEITAFDRPPFEGRIPSSAWGIGFIANDDLTITLPEDMPEGTYTLTTGLYSLVTGQRLGIVGDFPNNIMPIDTIVIE